jgi:hypothetical protein
MNTLPAKLWPTFIVYYFRYLISWHGIGKNIILGLIKLKIIRKEGK